MPVAVAVGLGLGVTLGLAVGVGVAVGVPVGVGDGPKETANYADTTDGFLGCREIVLICLERLW